MPGAMGADAVTKIEWLIPSDGNIRSVLQRFAAANGRRRPNAAPKCSSHMQTSPWAPSKRCALRLSSPFLLCSDRHSRSHQRLSLRFPILNSSLDATYRTQFANMGRLSDDQDGSSDLAARLAKLGVKDISSVKAELYPPVEPNCTGFLPVSDIHTLYWEESGNPTGQPIVFLHGGPGGGTSAGNRQFFDPEFYRIILFDQRGAGKSTPHACLDENTTWDLVNDIEKLREHLKIEKWQVFGGSWGSALALVYTQSYPEKVIGIVLRGICLVRKKELDWFYQGGASAIYPDAWEPYRDHIPEEERHDFVAAYSKRLNSTDESVQLAAAKAWTNWEMEVAHLVRNEESVKRVENEKFTLALARIENHYFRNCGFLVSDSHILDSVDKIRHIPAVIVQGRYDICCPMMSAWDLHREWPEADFRIVATAGHSADEPGITSELVTACELHKALLHKGP